MRTHPSIAVLAVVLGLTGAAGSAAQTASATPQDFCKLLTMAEAGAVLGAPVTEAIAMPPQGSLLGGCRYPSANGLVMVNARPAQEFERSVKAYPDLQSVDVAGAKAYYARPVGLMMSQSGKAYFLHITMVGGTKTPETFMGLAKQIAAK